MEGQTSGLRVVYILGEDTYQDEPTINYCQSYAGSYVDDASRFFIDHDGYYSWATTFTNICPSLSADGSLSLPATSLLDAQTFEHKYSGPPSQTLMNELNALLN